MRRRLAPWIALERYCRLTLPWAVARRARAAVGEPPRTTVRVVERAELEQFSADPEYDLSPRFLERLQARPDLCIGAFVDARPVCYAFASSSATQIDEHLLFHFPERWLYIYKAFTHPEVRGKRLLSELFLHGLPLISDSVPSKADPLGFVTLVLSHNVPSLRAFGRLGFQPEDHFALVRLRSRPFLPSRPVNGFFLEKTEPDRRSVI